MSITQTIPLVLKDLYENTTPLQKAYFEDYIITTKGWQFFQDWENEIYPLRNLNWRDNRWLSVDQAVKELAGIMESYNEFSPKFLLKLLDINPNIKVQLAREGSVAVYLKGITAQQLIAKLGDGFADEIDDWKDGTLRLWWD
jgi:hypothetical protein